MASSMNGNGALPKVLIFQICKDRFRKTDGTTNWRREIVEMPEISDLVVRASSMRVHWYGEDFTANFEAKIDMDWSVTGEIRSTAFDLIAAQTANGQDLGADVAARSNLGLNPRVGITCRNGTGTAIESGRVTAYLEIVLQT